MPTHPTSRHRDPTERAVDYRLPVWLAALNLALGNLAQRFLVAVVAVPLLLLLLYYDRPEPAWLLIFVASILAMREFFGMTLPPEALMRSPES